MKTKSVLLYACAYFFFYLMQVSVKIRGEFSDRVTMTILEIRIIIGSMLYCEGE